MKPITVVTLACFLLFAAASAAPEVAMQDTISMAQGGDIAQVASNDAQVASDNSILYQSTSQSAVGTGDVYQEGVNTGSAAGDFAYVNEGIIQSAEGDNIQQVAFNGLPTDPVIVVGDGTTVGQSITQGATAANDATQYGANYALIAGGDTWVGQLVQSGAIGDTTDQYAFNYALVDDISGIGNNALGQSIILGATSMTDAEQDGINQAILDGGDGNVAQLAQAGAMGDTIDQNLWNVAWVLDADTFIVGQSNIAGAETDMSVGTFAEQYQYNIVYWEIDADGMLNQHIEGANFADIIIQDQQDIVNLV